MWAVNGASRLFAGGPRESFKTKEKLLLGAIRMISMGCKPKYDSGVCNSPRSAWMHHSVPILLPIRLPILYTTHTR